MMLRRQGEPSPGGPGWERRAVVYEVYIRSFADANGDGIGDIAGIRSRLPYLRDLGVDALWVTPWYPSPQVDGGYDVADYRAIDPQFGTLGDAVGLIADAHALGLRVIADIVPNHTSSAHPWFLEALAAQPESAARSRYVFRDGRGAGGSEPPSDWLSIFGGPAWTRIHEADGRPGQWYLHMFDAEQPDLEWSNLDVRAEFEDILRTWFERGVDGFRIDVASSLVKDHGRPGQPHKADPASSAYGSVNDPLMNQPGVHEIYRGWRRVADAQVPPRILLGEVHAPNPAAVAGYLGADELHGAFNFHFLRCPWEATALRSVIDETIAAHASVPASPTWVLSNHDEIRHVTRYGRSSTGIGDRSADERLASDLKLGTRRAGAAALLMLALPGAVYLYQGEELGLPEVADLPDGVLRDPAWERSGHAMRGRDGCRVPIPWSGKAIPFGFGPTGTAPWLPQPGDWGRRSVAAQSGDPRSMLELYRRALRIRHEHPGLAGDTIRWLTSPGDVLLFGRDAGFACAVNLSAEPFPLPAGVDVLLCSDAAGPSGDRMLAADAAAWFVR
jgi:alpha-glucosidase